MSSDDPNLPKSGQALLKNNRAFILAALGRLDESIRYASDAVELLHRTGPGNSSDANATSLCVSMLNLCQSLDKVGRIQTALEVARQCALFAEQIPSSLSEAQTAQLRAKALATLLLYNGNIKGHVLPLMA